MRAGTVRRCEAERSRTHREEHDEREPGECGRYDCSACRSAELQTQLALDAVVRKAFRVVAVREEGARGAEKHHGGEDGGDSKTTHQSHFRQIGKPGAAAYPVAPKPTTTDNPAPPS